MKKEFLAVTFAAGLVAAPMAFADAAKGEALFNDKGATKCLVCHAFGKKVVGPDLAGVGKIHTKPWIVKWLTDTQGTWVANDPETADLKKRQNKATKPKPAHMTPKLTEEQAGDIADFLMTK